MCNTCVRGVRLCRQKLWRDEPYRALRCCNALGAVCLLLSATLLLLAAGTVHRQCRCRHVMVYWGGSANERVVCDEHARGCAWGECQLALQGAPYAAPDCIGATALNSDVLPAVGGDHALPLVAALLVAGLVLSSRWLWRWCWRGVASASPPLKSSPASPPYSTVLVVQPDARPTAAANHKSPLLLSASATAGSAAVSA